MLLLSFKNKRVGRTSKKGFLISIKLMQIFPKFGCHKTISFLLVRQTSLVILNYLFKLKGGPGFYLFCFCQKTNCLLKWRKLWLKTWCWAKNPDGIILPFSNKKIKGSLFITRKSDCSVTRISSGNIWLRKERQEGLSCL